MTDNVRFVYVTQPNGRKTTVAYQYDDANSRIKLATAQCSKRDQFVKKIGRNVAFGRLATKGGLSVSFKEIGGEKYGQIAQYVTANLPKLIEAETTKYKNPVL